MIKNAILDTLEKIWPMMVIFIVVLASIRIMYFLYNKQDKLVLYKELVSLLFIIYVLFLFYIVTFQDNNYGFSNYIPFQEMFRYNISSSLFLRNVVGNILLFAPLGWFITYYTKTSKIFPALFLSIFISLVIEMIQLNIGRVFDIDDIILNVFGGLFGYIIYMLFYRIKERLPSFLQKPWFLNIILIIVFMLFILYFTNWYKLILGGL
jgi:glycopeptide antibiotics resistance protein